MSDAEKPLLVLERSAARRVYDTDSLRQAIFDQCDTQFLKRTAIVLNRQAFDTVIARLWRIVKAVRVQTVLSEWSANVCRLPASVYHIFQFIDDKLSLDWSRIDPRFGNRIATYGGLMDNSQSTISLAALRTLIWLRSESYIRL